MATGSSKRSGSESDSDSFEKSELKPSDSDDEDHTELSCDVCSKTFSGFKPYVSHMQGSSHKKKLQEQKMRESIISERNILIGENYFKTCEVCDKEFSGIKPYLVHMKSSVHQKTLKRNEMVEKIKDLCIKDDSKKFICKECKNPFTDPFSFKAHIENNSHKKYETKNKIKKFIISNTDIVACKTVLNASSDADDPDDYRMGDYILLCKICKKSFCGPESAMDHVQSKKHLKTKHEREMKKIFHQKISDKSTSIGLKDVSAAKLNDDSDTNNENFEML